MRLKGENKCQSTLGTGPAVWRGGANTENTTVTHLYLQGIWVYFCPPAAPPTPGRTAEYSNASLPAPAWQVKHWGKGKSRARQGHLGARSVEDGVTWDPQSQLGAGLGEPLHGPDATSRCQGSYLPFLESPLLSPPELDSQMASLLPEPSCLG